LVTMNIQESAAGDMKAGFKAAAGDRPDRE
jgi:hypothetical protein